VQELTNIGWNFAVEASTAAGDPVTADSLETLLATARPSDGFAVLISHPLSAPTGRQKLKTSGVFICLLNKK